jgi:hypothetical protein
MEVDASELGFTRMASLSLLERQGLRCIALIPSEWQRPERIRPEAGAEVSSD